MDPRRFATWKYRHQDRVSLSRRQRQITMVTSLLILVALPLAVPVAAALAIALAIYLSVTWPRVGLIVGPRTLQCGNTLVYFSQVTRLQLDQAAGTLTLSGNDRELFRLDRERFPTNARKTDKIARNKQAKFDRVAARLAERVRTASPGAEIRGVTP